MPIRQISPPWLQPEPFCGLVPALPGTDATAACEPTADDWAAAWRLATMLDGSARPADATEAPGDFRVYSPESLWVVFGLLAAPRIDRSGSGRVRSLPAADAAMTVTDAFRRNWRIGWHHETGYPRFTAATTDTPPQVIAVTSLPRAWWPLLVHRPHHLEQAPETGSAAPETNELPELWVCPAWCELPGGHTDWRATDQGMTRTHHGTFPLITQGRQIKLVLTVDEHATGGGIAWGTPDIQLADALTPSPAEATVLHCFARHLGTVLRQAAQPLPGRPRVVADRHYIEIPAQLCTPSGIAAHRTRRRTRQAELSAPKQTTNNRAEVAS